MQNYLELTQKLISRDLGSYNLIVVSDGEPYMHVRTWGGVECKQTAGGLTMALDPVLQACHGTWIARGTGNADRSVVNERNEVKVPPGEDLYTLRRIWLNKKEIDCYYTGFSNSAMWPLCHNAYHKPEFSSEDYEYFKTVNKKFADATVEEAQDSKLLIYVQDYQLALASMYIKEKLPEAIVGQFWHIPWPSAFIYTICPWDVEILESLLMNDFIGFHTVNDVKKFLSTVENLIPEYTIDYRKSVVISDGHRTRIISRPISVDYNSISRRVKGENAIHESEKIERRFENTLLGIGVDRIDYTKGLTEKFRFIDRFLEKYPDYQGKITFVQMAILDRERLPAYEKLDSRLDRLVADINWKYSTDYWCPIEYIKERVPFDRVLAMYNKARFCLVTSLQDGLNIVCKEFVSAQSLEDPGVLLLSEFAGATEELKDAILINPYDRESCADAIDIAIRMSLKERKRRMNKLKKIVRENDIFKWSYETFKEFQHTITLNEAKKKGCLYKMQV